MKRFLPFLFIFFTAVLLTPDFAWSQDDGSTTQQPAVTQPTRGKRGQGGRTTANRTATPAASAKPTPTPTPPPPPAVIYSLAPGVITVIQGDPAATTAYKVTRYSTITLNGQPAAYSALKAGMRVVITPTSDMVYANEVDASNPPPVAPTPPPAPAVLGTAESGTAGPAPAVTGAATPAASPAAPIPVLPPE